MRHPEIKSSTYTSTAITNKRYFVYAPELTNDNSRIYSVASRDGNEEDAVAVMFDMAIQKFADFTFATKRTKIHYESAGKWNSTGNKYSREHPCVQSLLLSYICTEKNVVDKVLENTRDARTK